MRTLKNNIVVYELEDPVSLVVYTKCPMKWKLIDQETGEEYIGQDPSKIESNGNCWSKISESTTDA